MRSRPLKKSELKMHRYNAVVDLIRKRIAAGTLKVGDRLPSVRQLSALTGYSSVTVHHGYELLESLGVCVAKPRSGFYLSKLPPQMDEFPEGETSYDVEPMVVHNLPDSLLLTWKRRGLEAFGAFYPSGELFHREEIDKVMRQVLRRGIGRNQGADAPEGDLLLRQEISKRAAKRGTFARAQDIVVTGSAAQALGLCLDTFTEPGDIVLVETPSYFPMLAAVKRRSLRVLELYSHPSYGADPEQFEYLLKNNNIKVALIMANQHYPTGCSYPEHSMQRIVAAAARHNVLILENNMFGDLRYDDSISVSLKAYDMSDTVVQFSSFENSMSPEYGIGWIVAGKYSRQLLATQYLSGYITRDGLVQRAVAEYLASHSQDRHLRRIRKQLEERMKRGIDLIESSFPSSCSISNPSGGFMCWLRAPVSTDARAISMLAVKENFSVLPGPVFSVDGSLKHFFALNFSFPWTDANENALTSLGRMIASATAAPR